MPDLHGWITQQITAVEDTARKAAALCGCHQPATSWSFRDGDEPTDGRILVVDDPHPGLKRKIGRKWNGSYEGLFMAEHVVRHDPANVLRRCTADRKILEHHAPAGGNWDPYACEGCGSDSEYGCLVDHTNDCPTLQALAEGYGLTEEQRAELDRPEPERPEPGPGFQMPDAIIESLASFWLGTRPVEPSPKDKAIKILEPELKKISGYVPIAEEPGPA